MSDPEIDTTQMSSLTVEDLMKLERMIYDDIMARKLRISYSVRDQMFSFSTLDQARATLEWIRGEIAVRQDGGGFSLATFVNA